MHFELFGSDRDPHIYQVLGEGRYRIFYAWRKTLFLDATMAAPVYTFTPPLRESYVNMDGKLKQFRTKRSLVKLFSPVYKSQIRNWMRKHKVNPKNASDQEMAEMITFIGNLR
jgi:hypothetical protein